MAAVGSEYRFPFARYPAVRIVLCVIVGIVLAQHCQSALWEMDIDFDRDDGVFGLGWLAAYLMVLLGLEWLNRVRIEPWLSYAVRLGYLGGLVFFGMILWLGKGAVVPEQHTKLAGLSGEEMHIIGVVSRVRGGTGTSLSATIDTDSLVISGHSLGFRSRIQVRTFRPDSVLAAQLQLNHVVSAAIRLRPYPERRNPNAFDVGSWLRREGVHASADLIAVHASAFRELRWSWLWWRSAMQNLLEQTISPDVRPLFMAVLLGEKSGMDSDIRTAFSRAGLSHLMAVSGMHVGFVLMPIWLIIPWFWIHPLGRSTGLLLIAFILLFYAGLTGFTASVSRASITACLLAVGKLFQRNRDSVNTTGVAALLILCTEPSFLYDIGFQLSFTAVMVILVLGPVLRDAIPTRIRFTWRGTLLQFLGISTMVQVGLFPLLAGAFGEFSVAGPVANTVGVPLTQALFLWSMVGLPLSAISPALGEWVMIPAEWMARALLWIVEVVGTQDLAWISVNEVSVLMPVIWLTGMGCLATVFIPEVRFRWLGLLLVLLCILNAGRLIEKLDPAVLEVTVFDVGQGDALLLKTPGGKHILYDTGVLTPFQNSGRSVILPELKARGVRKLDAVILSHPHADHIGGIHSILQEMPVDVIYQAPLSYRSAVFAGYMALAREKGIPITELRAGAEISPDRSMRMLVMHPSQGVSSTDPNAHSVAIKVVYGTTSFLLTGDAEEVAEYMMVARYDTLLQSNWLKAGHHGSKTSSGSAFLDRVQPDIVAVSLGLSNRYRHPHTEAIVRIREGNPELRYTSLDKALVYESDGASVRQIMWEVVRRPPPIAKKP